MTPEAADWVYEHVLVGPDWHGNTASGSKPPHILRHCRCQGGVCGWCWAGHHTQCTTLTQGPIVGCETHLFPFAASWDYIPVWLSGTPCAWRCACGCTRTEPAAAAEPVRVVEQLELFDLAGGVR